jgi:hypothetical protein
MIFRGTILMPAFYAAKQYFKKWMMVVYDGEMPVTREEESSGNILCKMEMEIHGNAYHCGGENLRSGTARYFRIYNNEGEVECQGDIGYSGCLMNMSSTTIVAGGMMHVDGRFA